MSLPLYKQLSKQQLECLISNCYTWKDLAKRIGYKGISGDSLIALQHYILNDLMIEYPRHFIVRKPATIRNRENIFKKNSTAGQSTLRK